MSWTRSAAAWRIVPTIFCATVQRRSIVILLSPYTENRIRKPMPVVKYRNGEQITGTAWSVRRYSKRKVELPIMSRHFLHFWRNGKPLSVKSAVCLCWPVPCGSAPATGDSILQAAAKFRAQMDRIANRVDDYAVNTHSCIVNAAMEYLARPERSKEKQKGQFQPER